MTAGVLVPYCRSRNVPRAALISLAVAVAAAVYAGSQVPLPQLRYLADYSVPLAAVVPVVHAVVLATTLYSPMADLESTAARPMRLIRAAHMAVTLLYAAVLAALPLVAGASLDMTSAAVRNVAGYLGLAMISARLFGSGLAWLLPLAMFGPTLLLGVRWDSTPEPWAWSIHGPASGSAAVTAAVLCAAGLVAAATAAPRRGERAERA
ncbi:hypothetical protein [Streptomyces sp. TRM49041]|uniref:hypothetical protein n=1 Tax=Streptomyces sp. TRM49041 TaxID=2603216 RepID=UPI0011ECC8DF|nr:hypothetical protein [Streptomyces sp. TRM49041]